MTYQIDQIKNAITPGMIAVFGGSAFYFHKMSKGENFNLRSFLINIILAFFVGWVMDKFMPEYMSQNIRSGLLACCGFLTFPILDYLDKSGFYQLLKISKIEK